MRRRHNRRRKNKQRKIIIFSLVGLLFIMAVGYSAFQTNLNINAKGNIVEINAAYQLKKMIVTSGDGLYEDEYEEGRYIYRGTNPDNYISFNNELWRIISIEKDKTLKIIRKNSLGAMKWDSENNRNNDNNTYCNRETTLTTNNETKYWGCSVWNKRENVYDDGTYSGTVGYDATLNTYLNTEYYNTLSEDKNYIQNHTFYIGKVPSAEVGEVYEAEKKDTWNGNIGLINVSDYLKASTNTGCTSLSSSRSTSTPCTLENGNYLDELKAETWSINGYISETDVAMVTYLRTVSYYDGQAIKGGISGYPSTTTYQVRPVLYLKANILLSGSGAESDSYKIVND